MGPAALLGLATVLKAPESSPPQGPALPDEGWHFPRNSCHSWDAGWVYDVINDGDQKEKL